MSGNVTAAVVASYSIARSLSFRPSAYLNSSDPSHQAVKNYGPPEARLSTVVLDYSLLLFFSILVNRFMHIMSESLLLSANHLYIMPSTSLFTNPALFNLNSPWKYSWQLFYMCYWSLCICLSVKLETFVFGNPFNRQGTGAFNDYRLLQWGLPK